MPNLAILGASSSDSYSGLFWAEKTDAFRNRLGARRDHSHLDRALQVFVLRKERFRWSLLRLALPGLRGVGVLPSIPGRATRASRLSDHSAVLHFLGGRNGHRERAVLPESKVTSAGAQMAIGGTLLLFSRCWLASGILVPTFRRTPRAQSPT